MVEPVPTEPVPSRTKTIAVVALSFLCWPVGLIWLWVGKGFSKRLRVIVTVVVAVGFSAFISIGVIGAIFGPKGPTPAIDQGGTARAKPAQVGIGLPLSRFTSQIPILTKTSPTEKQAKDGTTVYSWDTEFGMAVFNGPKESLSGITVLVSFTKEGGPSFEGLMFTAKVVNIATGELPNAFAQWMQEELKNAKQDFQKTFDNLVVHVVLLKTNEGTPHILIDIHRKEGPPEKGSGGSDAPGGRQGTPESDSREEFRSEGELHGVKYKATTPKLEKAVRDLFGKVNTKKFSELVSRIDLVVKKGESGECHLSACVTVSAKVDSKPTLEALARTCTPLFKSLGPDSVDYPDGRKIDYGESIDITFLTPEGCLLGSIVRDVHDNFVFMTSFSSREIYDLVRR